MNELVATPPSEPGYECPPAKVQAAQTFLQFIESAQNPPNYSDIGKSEGRPITDDEKACYESALTVLLRYFESEDQWGPSTAPPTPPDGDDPKEPEPAEIKP